MTPPGNVIDTQNANNRIEYNGWTVALFGNVEEKNIPPQGTEIIDVAFQAPDLDYGEISVRSPDYTPWRIRQSENYRTLLEYIIGAKFISRHN